MIRTVKWWIEDRLWDLRYAIFGRPEPTPPSAAQIAYREEFIAGFERHQKKLTDEA